jgi:hypothetical protein
MRRLASCLSVAGVALVGAASRSVHRPRRPKTVGTVGRLTILRADTGSVSGTVYANLHQKNGMRQAELNGTWSCRTTVG